MCKPPRYVDRVSLRSAEFEQCVPTESRRTASQVHYGIEYSSFYAINQFYVVLGRHLKMQSPDHATMGARIEFLGKIRAQSALGEQPFVKNLDEPPTLIVENAGLDFHAARYGGLAKLEHQKLMPKKVSIRSAAKSSICSLNPGYTPIQKVSFMIRSVFFSSPLTR